MTVSLQSCVTFFTGCQSKRGLTLRLEYELTYKAPNGLAPSYLSEMLMPVAVNLALRRNRSADRGDLTMPRAENTSYSDRSFAIAAPMMWNNFPVELRCSSSMTIFPKDLRLVYLGQRISSSRRTLTDLDSIM